MKIKSIAVFMLLFFVLVPAACSGSNKNSVEMRMRSYVNTEHRWDKSPVHTVVLSATRSKEALKRYNDVIKYLDASEVWIPQAAVTNLYESQVVLHVLPDQLNVEVHSPWLISVDEVDMLNQLKNDDPIIPIRDSYLFQFPLYDESFKNDDLLHKIESVVLETLLLYYEDPSKEEKPSEREKKEHVKTEPSKIA